MGILSVVKTDVEELVKSGYDDNYISKAVGLDLNVIGYIINYVKEQNKDNSIKINNRDVNKGG